METPEPKSFKDGLQFAWDSTSIKLAEECLRKYQYKMIGGWTPFEASPHLRFGGVYASALEHFYKHRAEGLSHDDALCEVVHEALFETWDYELDEAGEKIPDSGKPWLSSHKLKTRENLIRTIIWYLEQFRGDSAEVVILANGKPAVEHSFALPVDDDIIFCGHLDRLVNYADNLMVMDQKTTGSTISSQYFEQFKPDVQMSMYTFAGKMIYQLPVRGVIIDAAQIAVGFTRFERGITMRTDSELQEFYDTTMHTIQQARTATALGHFPMNRTSCDKFGGCEFRKVCSKSPEVRKNFLKADFEQGPRWDPLETR